MEDFFTLKNIIEMIGYLGSALVIVSMLMTSVIKLRIINTAGSVIFAVYAFIIHSYPTAVMQLFLIAINVFNLYKLYNTKKEYSAVNLNWGDSFLTHFIQENKDDILKFFPEAEGLICRSEGHNKSYFDAANDESFIDDFVPNFTYIVCCGSVPAGVFIGKKTDGSVKVLVDYTTPSYRDCSVGKFLYNYLSAQTVNKNLTMIAQAGNKNHENYLKKMGFNKDSSGKEISDIKDFSGFSDGIPGGKSCVKSGACNYFIKVIN